MCLVQYIITQNTQIQYRLQQWAAGWGPRCKPKPADMWEQVTDTHSGRGNAVRRGFPEGMLREGLLYLLLSPKYRVVDGILTVFIALDRLLPQLRGGTALLLWGVWRRGSKKPPLHLQIVYAYDQLVSAMH